MGRRSISGVQFIEAVLPRRKSDGGSFMPAYVLRRSLVSQALGSLTFQVLITSTAQNTLQSGQSATPPQGFATKSKVRSPIDDGLSMTVRLVAMCTPCASDLECRASARLRLASRHHGYFMYVLSQSIASIGYGALRHTTMAGPASNPTDRSTVRGSSFFGQLWPATGISPCSDIWTMRVSRLLIFCIHRHGW
jgi:hypothetical protein